MENKKAPLAVRMILRQRQEESYKIWAAKQDANTLLLHKLCKRYKIRVGQQEWIDRDTAREMRLQKLVAHFKKETGIQITFRLESKEHRAPYSVSFLGL